MGTTRKLFEFFRGLLEFDERSSYNRAMETKSLAKKDATEEQRREAARLMGSARTEAKIAAAVRNLAARSPDALGGRPLKRLAEIERRCGAGEALEGHAWDCPRGQAIKRRRKAGKL